MIQDIAGKIKGFLGSRELFPVLLLLLVGIASFGLGRLAERASSPASGMEAAVAGAGEVVEAGTLGEANLPPAAGYVASRHGEKYHLPWCAGAGHIASENEVWFATEEEARAAGYEPAANCRGI